MTIETKAGKQTAELQWDFSQLPEAAYEGNYVLTAALGGDFVLLDTAPSLRVLLALGGDIGCSGGPTVVGLVSGALEDNLKMGILAGVIFPVVLLAGIVLCRKEEAL